MHCKLRLKSARLLYQQFASDVRVTDFKIIASHNESLHSHNAVAEIVKGVPNGFTTGVSRDTWNSLGLR
jgi:GTP cyclohydrolase I